MSVTLSPEIETYLNEKVASGQYPSINEVLRDAVRLLKEQDAIYQMRLEELRREVQRGFDQIENGEYTDYDTAEEIIAHIAAEGRKRVAVQAKVAT